MRTCRLPRGAPGARSCPEPLDAQNHGVGLPRLPATVPHNGLAQGERGFDIRDPLHEDKAAWHAAEPKRFVELGYSFMQGVHDDKPGGHGPSSLHDACECVSDKDSTEALATPGCGQGKPGQENGGDLDRPSSSDSCRDFSAGDLVGSQRVIADNLALSVDPDPGSCGVPCTRRNGLFTQPGIQGRLTTGETADVVPLGVEVFRVKGHRVSRG